MKLPSQLLCIILFLFIPSFTFSQFALIKYEIKGTALSASVSYTDQDAGHAQRDRVIIPWSETLIISTPFSAQLTAQNHHDSGSIEVRISYKLLTTKQVETHYTKLKSLRNRRQRLANNDDSLIKPDWERAMNKLEEEEWAELAKFYSGLTLAKKTRSIGAYVVASNSFNL